MSQDSSKERQVMMIMRKLLAQIIKDTTPPNRAMKHPLSANTIEDIRNCLGLISARERELADEAGIAQERPYFVDEKKEAEVVSINTLKKSPKKTDS